MSEIQNPIHVELGSVISERRGIICESVHSEFKELVLMCGGPSEKFRANQLLKCLMWVSWLIYFFLEPLWSATILTGYIFIYFIDFEIVIVDSLFCVSSQFIEDKINSYFFWIKKGLFVTFRYKAVLMFSFSGPWKICLTNHKMLSRRFSYENLCPVCRKALCILYIYA